MLRLLSCTSCAIALSAAPAQAQEVFIADLRGANENPPVASPGTGSAIVLIDSAAQTMTVRSAFGNLTTPTTDAHIHCCTVPTSNTGVAVGFRPAGFPVGVTSGDFAANFDLNATSTYNPPFLAANGGTAATAKAALLSGIRNELAYVNIHTTGFPPGEIRGQLMTGRDLTAEAYSLLPEVILQTAEFQDTTIRRYMSDFRGGGRGLPGQRASLDEDGRIGMFLIGNTRFGEFDEKAGRPRVDIQSRGLMGGADVRLAGGTLLGVLGGVDRSEPSLTPTSGRSEVDSWFVGAYSSLVLGPASIDLHGSYGKSDFDLQRHLSVGTFAAESMAEGSSEQWMLAGTAGVSLGMGAIDVEPYAGARYIDFNLEGFTETGNIAALTIGQQEVRSLQSIVGLRLGAEAPAMFATVRGSLTAEWRHEFKDDGARRIAGSFGGAAPFSFATTPLKDDHLVIGAGLAVSEQGPVSLTVSYTGQLLGGYDVHGLNGGVRLAF